MIKSLYAKLALTLIALLFVTAIVYSAISYYLTQKNINAEVQRENADIALNLSNEITQTVSGEIDLHYIDQLFQLMIVVNPDVQLYLLDPEGKITSASVGADLLVLDAVALDPLQEFLSNDRQFPLFAQDPLAEDSAVTFSVAELKVTDRSLGFLYVTLRGQADDSPSNGGIRELISTIGVSALLGSLLVSLLAGLYVFKRITSRLQTLSSEIEAFRISGFRKTRSYPDLSGDNSDDEISRLGASYDEMATRIVDQFHLLEVQDQNRRSFIANVSHDLLTPLTATQGYLEILVQKNERLDVVEREKYLGIALKHSNRLKVLISDLFELAKLEDYREGLDLETVSLSDVIGDVHQGCLPQATSKDITLEFHGTDTTVWVEVDLGMIDRAVSNLLVNAIQYTPDGGKIIVSMEPDAAAERVKLCVEDNGPGIDPGELKKIFKRFHRADNEHNEGGNAGLGLAITQRIVELHGDTLLVENTGNGTRFSFYLPIGSPPG